MNVRDVINYKIFGLIGSLLIIISEFLPWFSSSSLFEIYYITISGEFEDAFLYLFPIFGGIICLLANILIILKIQFKIKSVILNIVGLGFLLLFFFEFIPIHSQYLLDNVGIYFCIIGFLLVVYDLILILMIDNQNVEGN